MKTNVVIGDHQERERGEGGNPKTRIPTTVPSSGKSLESLCKDLHDHGREKR